jgi:5-methylcytosine-specific restriction enzyme subunit McrC
MIQVREYATLTTAPGAESSLDRGVISDATLDWLIRVGKGWKSAEPILLVEDRRSLKLGSHVGYLRSPSGESIEILPKTGLGKDHPAVGRRVLQTMLRSALNLQAREATAADLLTMNTPIHEWVFAQFLHHLNGLLRRGLRFWYEDIEEESRYLRGQLMVVSQMRQPPERRHLFQVRHSVFTPDRVENRLLRTALDFVRTQVRSAESWRLANELSHRIDEIPPLSDPVSHLPLWQNSKLMQPYRAVYPWCSLILERLNPNFQKGAHDGIALLFPMEKLFERHVEVCLRASLPRGFQLSAQIGGEHLLSHRPGRSTRNEPWFQLQPDLLLRDTRTAELRVLDTKWKLIDETAANTRDKYNISQTDLYQLFAYGRKYLNGHGEMMLIYPKHERFNRTLPVFDFDDGLLLHAVPFCLESGRLVDSPWTLGGEPARALSA